jgi:hypothetical protein
MRFRDGRVTESDSDDDRPYPTQHRRWVFIIIYVGKI